MKIRMLRRFEPGDKVKYHDFLTEDRPILEGVFTVAEVFPYKGKNRWCMTIVEGLPDRPGANKTPVCPDDFTLADDRTNRGHLSELYDVELKSPE